MGVCHILDCVGSALGVLLTGALKFVGLVEALRIAEIMLVPFFFALATVPIRSEPKAPALVLRLPSRKVFCLNFCWTTVWRMWV